jgi:hypothetical protein
MSEITAGWISAVVAVLLLFGSIGGVYVMLAQRITRLETFFEVFGRKAAQILHSPHTPELDNYLEKYIANTMSDGDWIELMKLCDALEICLLKPKEERVLAAIISIHCRKKLGLPLPGMHKHTETTTE